MASEEAPLLGGGAGHADGSVPAAPGPDPAHKFPEHQRKIQVGQLAVLSYALVCGGPIGSEMLISSGGPLLGLVMTLVTALVWAHPVAMVTAEISAALPHDGGFVIWAYVAHGKFWAVQQAFWSWFAGVVVNGVYPVLAFDVAVHFLGEPSWFVGYLIKAAATVLLCCANLAGTSSINRVLYASLVLVLVPFAVMVVIAVPQMQWGHLMEARFEGDTALPFARVFSSAPGPALAVRWADLTHALIWNFNGFHGTSMYAGEVADPGTTYPRALLWSVVATCATYILPLAAGAGVNRPPWLTWVDGSLSAVATEVGGTALGAIITVTSAFSAAAMFVSELFSDTYQLVGMAEMGIAPAALAYRHPTRDTPVVAIIISMAIMLLLVTQTFTAIISVSNVFTLLSILQLLASAAVLRAKYPDIRKHSKMQYTDCQFMLMLVSSVACAAFALVIMLVVDVNTPVLVITGVCIVLGIAYYYVVDATIPTRVTREALEEELLASADGSHVAGGGDGGSDGGANNGDDDDGVGVKSPVDDAAEHVNNEEPALPTDEVLDQEVGQG